MNDEAAESRGPSGPSQDAPAPSVPATPPATDPSSAGAGKDPTAELPPAWTPPAGEVPEADDPPTGAIPATNEPPTGAIPATNEPPTGAIPRADEPPTGAIPRGHEPPTGRIPAGDEPPFASPPPGDIPPPPPGAGTMPPWMANLGGPGFSRDHLVRPRQGRYVAGVCAALARATNTDPVLWRVLMAVLGILSGVGVLLYLIGWLIIPAEGDTASPIESLLGKGRSGMAPLSVVVLGAAAVFSFAFIVHDGMRASVLVAAVILGVVLLIKRGGVNSPGEAAGFPASAPPPGAAPGPVPPASAAAAPAAPFNPAQPAGQFGTAESGTAQFGTTPYGTGPYGTGPSGTAQFGTGQFGTGQFGTAPAGTGQFGTSPFGTAQSGAPAPGVPADEPVTAPLAPEPPTGSGYRPPFAPHGPWGPTAEQPAVPPQRPPRPPRRPRERSKLGRLTFFAVVVVVGVLAVLNMAGAHFAVSAFFAAALVTIALGLIVGAWFGRARGLIALAVIAALGLAGSTTAERFGSRIGHSVYRPASLAAVADRYDFTAGNATLDLRGVDFAGQPAQTVTATMKIGQLRVLLPPTVDTTATVRLNNGRAVVLGHELNDHNVDGTTVSDQGTDGAGGGTLQLDLQMDTGNLEVTR